MSTPVTNAEIDLFREAGRDFIAQGGSVGLARRLSREGTALERDWWQQAAELGWTMLLAPERLGGDSPSGERLMDLVEIAALCGEHVAPGPLLTTSAIVTGLTHPAARAGHDQTIEALMEGSAIGAWAAPAVVDEEPSVTAAWNDGRLVLTGVAPTVEFGVEADLVLVAAAIDGGIVHALVPAGAPGLIVTRTGSIDPVRPFGRIDFDAVVLTDAAIVVGAEHGRDVLAAQLRCINVLQVAEAVGAVGRVFDFTVAWGMDRYSFGRPLASYQALKHRYADDATHLYACRALLAAASRAVQNEAPEADRLVSAAKAYVGQVGVQIVQNSCQLHGGLSQTMEHDLHLYLRRVMLARELYGNVRQHRARVASIVIEEEAA